MDTHRLLVGRSVGKAQLGEQRALKKDIIKTYHTCKILRGSALGAGCEAISCQIGSLLHGGSEVTENLFSLIMQ